MTSKRRPLGTGFRYLGAWTVLVAVGTTLVVARYLAAWLERGKPPDGSSVL